jgi:hypothetical protein
MKYQFHLKRALWLTAPLTLEALCDELSNIVQLPSFDFDFENLYEWGIAYEDTHHVELNVSRKHAGGEPRCNDPFHILLISRAEEEPFDELVRLSYMYAERIASQIGVPVYAGEIRYLGGDDYAYDIVRVFSRTP